MFDSLRRLAGLAALVSIARSVEALVGAYSLEAPAPLLLALFTSAIAKSGVLLFFSILTPARYHQAFLIVFGCAALWGLGAVPWSLPYWTMTVVFWAAGDLSALVAFVFALMALRSRGERASPAV